MGQIQRKSRRLRLGRVFYKKWDGKERKKGKSEETDCFIIIGRMIWVMRSVPVTLIATMSAISCSDVSAKSVGIVCDLPTLFTVKMS